MILFRLTFCDPMSGICWLRTDCRVSEMAWDPECAKVIQETESRHCISYKGYFIKDHVAWLVMEYFLGSASNLLEVHKKKTLAENEIPPIMQDSLMRSLSSCMIGWVGLYPLLVVYSSRHQGGKYSVFFVPFYSLIEEIASLSFNSI